MEIPIFALIISLTSLVATVAFATLNFRFARRSNARADAAETRADANEERAKLAEERSLERSRVVWRAALSDSGYVVLSNTGSDSALDVRITYTVMNPPYPKPGYEAPGSIFLSSSTTVDHAKWGSTFELSGQKGQIAPGQAVGLPIMPGTPFDFTNEFNTGRAFGLALDLEWRTQHGSPRSEALLANSLPVILSGYEFPDLLTLPISTYQGEEPIEAIEPTMTPEEQHRIAVELGWIDEAASDSSF
jgi:hypothetical protein